MTGAPRIAIVGSRTYPRMDLVIDYVARDLPENAVVISGGARGVDTVAVAEARACGMETVVHKADWDTHGKKAGFLRNQTIVDDAHAVVVFWDFQSRGTLDTIRKAIRAGKLAWVRNAEGEVFTPSDLGFDNTVPPR